MVKKPKPLKVDDNLYLRLPNKPMGLEINDIYGVFMEKTEKDDQETDTKIVKFTVLNIRGELIQFSKEIFDKWFSNEPIDITKIKKKKEKDLGVSMTPTKVVRRKA